MKRSNECDLVIPLELAGQRELELPIRIAVLALVLVRGAPERCRILARPRRHVADALRFHRAIPLFIRKAALARDVCGVIGRGTLRSRLDAAVIVRHEWLRVTHEREARDARSARDPSARRNPKRSNTARALFFSASSLFPHVSGGFPQKHKVRLSCKGGLGSLRSCSASYFALAASV